MSLDLFLYTATGEDMTAALTAAGVIDEEGNHPLGIDIEQIGPFQRVTGYDDAGEPIIVDYPDWHTNLRGSFSDEQLAALEPLRVNPAVPYRVFA
jgi:hypothetical protein